MLWAAFSCFGLHGLPQQPKLAWSPVQPKAACAIQSSLCSLKQPNTSCSPCWIGLHGIGLYLLWATFCCFGLHWMHWADLDCIGLLWHALGHFALGIYFFKNSADFLEQLSFGYICSAWKRLQRDVLIWCCTDGNACCLSFPLCGFSLNWTVRCQNNSPEHGSPEACHGDCETVQYAATDRLTDAKGIPVFG